MSTLQRNLQHFSRQSVPKIQRFSQYLETNSEKIFNFIKFMVVGKSRNECCEYILSYFAYLIKTQIKADKLKQMTRFLMALSVTGQLHIYQYLAQILLQPMYWRIIEKEVQRTVFPLKLFCLEFIYVLSQWLPQHFYKKWQPSPFKQCITKLGFVLQHLKFMTIEKLIISYRIIKSLQLDGLGGKDQFSSSDKSFNFDFLFEEQTKKQIRQKLYVRQVKSLEKSIWKTGFEIEESEITKLKKKKNQDKLILGDLMFKRLDQKVELLEAELKCLKQGPKEEEPRIFFQTPKKIRETFTEVSTNAKTLKKNYRNEISPTNKPFDIEDHQQEFPMSDNFPFKSVTNLSGKQLDSFKCCLLSFNQKIYFKKSSKSQIFCVLVCKCDRIKIKICYQGENHGQNLKLQSRGMKQSFNSNRKEFVVNIEDNFSPLVIYLEQDNTKTKKIVLPVGYIKMLKFLSFDQKEDLSFKYLQTVKLQNSLISSYEFLLQLFLQLEKILGEGEKISPPFEKKRLREYYFRKCKLMGTQMSLRIKNNNTQYVSFEINCLDDIISREKAMWLMKELCFICSSSQQ